MTNGTRLNKTNINNETGPETALHRILTSDVRKWTLPLCQTTENAGFFLSSLISGCLLYPLHPSTFKKECLWGGGDVPPSEGLGLHILLIWLGPGSSFRASLWKGAVPVCCCVPSDEDVLSLSPKPPVTLQLNLNQQGATSSEIGYRAPIQSSAKLSMFFPCHRLLQVEFFLYI